MQMKLSAVSQLSSVKRSNCRFVSTVTFLLCSGILLIYTLLPYILFCPCIGQCCMSSPEEEMCVTTCNHLFCQKCMPLPETKCKVCAKILDATDIAILEKKVEVNYLEVNSI